MKKTVLLILAAAMALTLCACGSKNTDDAGEWGKTRHAEITIKDYGTVKLELYEEVAPITVANFISLAQQGFYDGLTFHRIMDGFMIQGGAANAASKIKPVAIKGEFSSNGVNNPIKHVDGVISMARTSKKDSATSQFFIMVGEAPHLDGNYAAFGKVTEGLDIVKKIAKDARPVDNNGTIPADQQPVIEKIVITD